jgi:hypothetical protein
MPIVQVIINEEGKMRTNLHFGQLSTEEYADLRTTIATKLQEYQQKRRT